MASASVLTCRITAAAGAGALVWAASAWLTLSQHEREGILLLFGLALASACYGIGVFHFGIRALSKPLRILCYVAGGICLIGTLLTQLSVFSVTAGHLLFTFAQLISIVVLARIGWSTLAQRQDDLVLRRARQRLPFALALLGLILVTYTVILITPLPLPAWLTGAQAMMAVLFVLFVALLAPGIEEAPTSSIGDDQVSRLEKAISPDLYRQAGLTVGKLAEAAGLPVQDVRDTILHGLGHERFSQYLDQLRTTEAKGVLESDLDAEQLSGLGWYLGYPSNSEFARAFKACTGDTPASYRRRTQLRSTREP